MEEKRSNDLVVKLDVDVVNALASAAEKFLDKEKSTDIIQKYLQKLLKKERIKRINDQLSSKDRNIRKAAICRIKSHVEGLQGLKDLVKKSASVPNKETALAIIKSLKDHFQTLLEYYDETVNPPVCQDVDELIKAEQSLAKEQSQLSEEPEFLELLQKLKSHNSNQGQSVFISHAWCDDRVEGNSKREEWIRSFLKLLYEHLAGLGFRVLLDLVNIRDGDSKAQFMEKNIPNSHYILLIGTESLFRKSQANSNADIKIELSLIRIKRLNDLKSKLYRVTPIVVNGSIKSSLPLEFRDLNTTARDWCSTGYLEGLKSLFEKLGDVGWDNEKYKSCWSSLEVIKSEKKEKRMAETPMRKHVIKDISRGSKRSDDTKVGPTENTSSNKMKHADENVDCIKILYKDLKIIAGDLEELLKIIGDIKEEKNTLKERILGNLVSYKNFLEERLIENKVINEKFLKNILNCLKQVESKWKSINVTEMIKHIKVHVEYMLELIMSRGIHCSLYLSQKEFEESNNSKECLEQTCKLKSEKVDQYCEKEVYLFYANFSEDEGSIISSFLRALENHLLCIGVIVQSFNLVSSFDTKDISEESFFIIIPNDLDNLEKNPIDNYRTFRKLVNQKLSTSEANIQVINISMQTRELLPTYLKNEAIEICDWSQNCYMTNLYELVMKLFEVEKDDVDFHDIWKTVENRFLVKPQEVYRPPVGESDFKKIIDSGCQYIDKTLFVKHVIDNKSVKVKIIIRPRRFGKTLNMSMLKYFLEDAGKDTRHLFKGRKIWNIDNGKYREHQGKYPVILLSFRTVSKMSFDLSYIKFKSLLAKEYERHFTLINNNSAKGISAKDIMTYQENMLNRDNRITKESEQEMVEQAISNLAEQLLKHYGVNPIVLIDEYDTPIHASYEHGYYKEMIDFMRVLLGSALKDNQDVNWAVLTGILRISKESLVSGFNNPVVYSFLDDCDYNEDFGFTDEEVNFLLNSYFPTHANELSRIEDWYGGYKAGGGKLRLYNPWSVVNLITTSFNGLAFKKYWTGGIETEMVKGILDTLRNKHINIFQSFMKKLKQIIQNENLTEQIDEHIVLSEVKESEKSLWNFLVLSGYLSATRADNSLDVDCYRIGIPNYELILFYRKNYKDWLGDISDKFEEYKVYLRKDDLESKKQAIDWLREKRWIDEETEKLLIDCLSNLYVEVREEALATLTIFSKEKSDYVIAKHIEHLSHTDEGVIQTAIEALTKVEKIESQEIYEALIKNLSHIEANVRENALILLRQLNKLEEAYTLQAIIANIHHKDKGARETSISTLIKLQQFNKSMLIGLLNSDDKYIKETGIYYLDQLIMCKDTTAEDKALFRGVLEVMTTDNEHNIREQVSKILLKLMSFEISLLIEIHQFNLACEDSGVREDAVKAIVSVVASQSVSSLEIEKSIDALVKIIDDSDVSVRRSAVKAIGKLQKKFTKSNLVSFNCLLRKLRDSDALVSKHAANALKGILFEKSQEVELVEAHEKNISDPKISVKQNAIEALGQLKEILKNQNKLSDICKKLCDCLSDINAEVRRSAIGALKKLKLLSSSQVIQYCIVNMHSSDQGVQETNLELLREVEDLTSVEGVIEKLLTVLSEDNPKVIRSVFLTINKLIDDKLIRPEMANDDLVVSCTKKLNYPDREIRKMTLELLNKLNKALDLRIIQTHIVNLLDKDIAVIIEATNILKRLKVTDGLAIKNLLNNLKHNNKEVRLSALGALKSLQQLGQIRSNVVIDACLVMLKEKDPLIRQNGTTILGELGVNDRPVVIALKEILTDASEVVRKEALASLVKLGISHDEDIIHEHIKNLRYTESLIKQTALMGLEELDIKQIARSVSQEIIAALVKACNDSDAKVSQYALSIIEKTYPNNYREIISKYTKKYNNTLDDRKRNDIEADLASKEIYWHFPSAPSDIVPEIMNLQINKLRERTSQNSLINIVSNSKKIRQAFVQQYIEDFAHLYRLIWWFDLSLNDLTTAYAELSTRINKTSLPFNKGVDTGIKIDLSSMIKESLLVYDNVQDYEALKAYLPESFAKCHVFLISLAPLSSDIAVFELFEQTRTDQLTLIESEVVISPNKEELEATSAQNILNTKVIGHNNFLIQLYVNKLLQSEDGEQFKAWLFSQIEASKNNPGIGIAASNAITILNRAGVSLSGKDFQGIRIPYADLSYALMSGSDLRNADLTGVNFHSAYLAYSNMSYANLKNADFGQWPALEHPRKVKTLCYSTDGKWLVTGDEQGILRVWDTDSSQCQIELKSTSEGALSSLSFYPKQFLVAAGYTNGYVRLWDIAREREQLGLKVHYLPVACLVFSADGNYLASGDNDGNVKVWEVKNWPTTQELAIGAGVHAIVFASDSNRLAVGSNDSIIRLWDIKSNQILSEFTGHKGAVLTLSFNADCSLLASGSGDKTVRLWDITAGQMKQVFTGHTGWVRTVAFNTDGSCLASGSDDGTVRLWDVASGQAQQVFMGDSNGITAIAFKPNDDSCLASGSDDGTVRLWNVHSRHEQKLKESDSNFDCVASLNADANLLAFNGGDFAIHVLNANTRQKQLVLKKHTSDITTLAFSPDSTHLVSGSKDKTMRLWDINNGQQRKLSSHGDWVTAIEFSIDGKYLVSGSWDCTVKLWDVANRQRLLLQPMTHFNYVSAVAISPDNNRLASGGGDYTVRIWDARTGKMERELLGHTAAITSLAFSPDGLRLASGGDDKTIRLWDIISGRIVQDFKYHRAPISILTFRPDGQSLASGDTGGIVAVWDLITGFYVVLSNGINKIVAIGWNLSSRHLSIVNCYHQLFYWQFPPTQSGGYVLLKADGSWPLTCTGLVLEGAQLNHSNEALLIQLGAQDSIQQISVLRNTTLKENSTLSISRIEFKPSQDQLSMSVFIGAVKNKYQKCSYIKSHFHKSLSIEQIYVNLALIEEEEQQAKEKDFLQVTHEKFQDNRYSSYEQIYEVKKQIALKDIFNLSKSKERVSIKHLLIIGRAGSGKSTLCQFMAYDWAKGALWQEQPFKVVLWIPLHKLLNYSKVECTIAKVVYKECLLKDDCVSNNITLEALEKWLVNFKSDILYILDGFDEIAQVANQSQEEETPQGSLIRSLLEKETFIITSRPYFIGDYLVRTGLPIDLRLENMGFVDQNIEQFIRCFFASDSRTILGKELIEYLNKNSVVKGIAHIPLNLSLLCVAWESAFLKSQKKGASWLGIKTMTDLYQALLVDLCRQYLIRYDRRPARTTEVLLKHPKCQPILTFLEMLAFDQMQREGPIIEKEDIDRVLGETENNFFNSVLNFGLINATENNEEQYKDRKVYYFIHFTFQDFFAARYIVSHFQEQKKFITKHKHNFNYELIWWFVAGLLRERAESLSEFFTIFNNEQTFDEVMLLIRCLDECELQLEERLKEPLLAELGQWVEKICGKEVVEYDEKILIDYLNRISPQINDILVKSVWAALLAQGNVEIRETVVRVLGAMSSPSAKMVALLLNATKDKNNNVRVAAIKAMIKANYQKINNIYNDGIFRLKMPIEAEDSNIRMGAIGNIPENISTKDVLTNFQDNSLRVPLSSKAPLLQATLQWQEEPIYFREEKVLGDGNCGFTVLGADRKQVAEVLGTLVNDPKAREALSEEIREALMTDQFATEEGTRLLNVLAEQQDREDRQLREVRNHFNALPTYADESLRRTINWLNEKGEFEVAEELGRISLQTLQAERALLLYCKSPEVFRIYIAELEHNQRLWLGYKSALLYAKGKNITLYIWTRSETNPSKLELQDHILGKSADIIHMLSTGGFTHFNLLVIIMMSLGENEEDNWDIKSFPFESYQTFVNYYLWLKNKADYSKEAEDERKSLYDHLLEHMANMNRTDEIVLDFVQLAYCEEEEITTQVVDRLSQWKAQHFSIYLLGAVARACSAIQVLNQKQPLTTRLLQLLKDLVGLNIRQTQEVQTFPAEILSHALYATNALLDCLYERASEDEKQREQAFNEKTYGELKKLFKDLKVNLQGKRVHYPWHYYLCYRAQETLKAIGQTPTAIQTRGARIQGAKNIGLALYDVGKSRAQGPTGTALLAAAIAGTVASMGGAAVTLPPAIIAFGTGWYKAYQSGKSGVQHACKAYLNLHREGILCLDGFVHNTREKVKPVLDDEQWKELKKQFAFVFKAKKAESWRSMNAMAAVYYFTELALSVKLPEDWIKSMRSLFATLYLYNLDDKYTHVRTFILTNSQRLHEAGYEAFRNVRKSKKFYIKLLSEGSPRYQLYRDYLSVDDKEIRLEHKKRNHWNKLTKKTKAALKKHHKTFEASKEIIKNDLSIVKGINLNKMMPLSKEPVTQSKQLKKVWQDWLPADIKCFGLYQILAQREPDDSTAQDIKREFGALRLTTKQVESLSFWGKLCLRAVVEFIDKIEAKEVSSRDQVALQGYSTKVEVVPSEGIWYEIPVGARETTKEDLELLTKVYEKTKQIDEKYPTCMEIKKILRRHMGPIVKRTERHHLPEAAPIGRGTLFHNAGPSSPEKDAPQTQEPSLENPSTPSAPGNPGKKG